MFHLWKITEVYSNADGSVQFIELRVNVSGENFIANHVISFTPTGGSAVNYTIPTNLVGNTSNKSLLLATSGFSSLPGGVTPDFIIPSGFLSAGGGTLNVFGVDSITFGTGVLPTDGVNSLNPFPMSASGTPQTA